MIYSGELCLYAEIRPSLHQMKKLKRYSIALLSRRVGLYLFCISQLQPVTANAQNSAGFFGGTTINYLETDLAGRSFTKKDPRIGLSVGASFERKIKDWLSVGTRLFFLQKNHETRRTGNYSNIFELHRRSYIQLPVFLSIKRNIGKIQCSIDLGCYGAYWVSGRLKGNIPDIFSVVPNPNGVGETFPLVSYNEPYDFSSFRDNRFEFGGVIGGGCSYPIDQRHFVFINIDYYHALTGDQKKYTINTIQAYNRTINVYAGIKSYLKKWK
jgi:hypothetical protein